MCLTQEALILSVSRAEPVQVVRLYVSLWENGSLLRRAFEINPSLSRLLKESDVGCCLLPVFEATNEQGLLAGVEAR